jgi:hypothetical protein
MADYADMRSDSESGGDESDSDDSRDGAGGRGGASDADLAAVMALEQSLQTHPDDYNLHAQARVAVCGGCALRTACALNTAAFAGSLGALCSSALL